MADSDTEVVKQQENKKLTGFAKYPENINRKGRPPKNWSWAELLEEVANEVEPKTGKPYKELVIRRLWIAAANGNLNAQKEIFDRMEGRPKQQTDITTNGNSIAPVLVEFIGKDGTSKD